MLTKAIKFHKLNGRQILHKGDWISKLRPGQVSLGLIRVNLKYSLTKTNSASDILVTCVL